MESNLGIRVQIDDLSSQDSRKLVSEHLAGMHANSPPGHVNALAIEALQVDSVVFWTAWKAESICGCGALAALSTDSGEIKSMRTVPTFLRQGVGQALLDTILKEARVREYREVYLETGTGPAFEPAHALYLRNGFEWCGPFGDYEATAFNVFMRKALTP